MVKKIGYSVLLSLIAVAIVFAGSNQLAKKQFAIDGDNAVSAVYNIGTSYLSKAAIAYNTLDTMANALGPATLNTNSIQYDPYSNSVVIIHRGKTTYAPTSGSIMYAYSTDGGTTWTKRMGPLQGGTQGNTNGRYPTVFLSNPYKAVSKDSILVIGVWPMLVGGAFGGMMYSVDPGLGANAPIPSALDTSFVWGSSFTIGGSTNSPEVLFGAADGYGVHVYRSTDGVTFTPSIPTQLDTTAFFRKGTTLWIDDVVSIVYRNDVFYMGIDAFWSDSLHAKVGVTKSTDKGATWSPIDVVNWLSLAGLTGYAEILSNDYSSANVKMTVDADNGIHFLATFVDTTSTKPDNKWTMFDLYKASGGSWVANKIADIPIHYNYAYGTLDQTTLETQLATSEDGKSIIAKWIQDDRGATFKDEVPITDMVVSAWTTTSKKWTAVQNVTNTADYTDILTQLAPKMSNDGTIHFFSVMQPGKRTNPDSGGTNYAAMVNYAKFKASLTGVRENNATVAGSFELNQNYPNPFNPATVISYTLPVREQVSLKVYNMLGQVVATLVNGQQQPGTYFIDFDASKLSSGIYFYSLTAGNFSSMKKMTLVK